LLTSVNNNPAFSAAYLFKGTTPQKKQFLNFIKEEINNKDTSLKSWEFGRHSMLVLSGDDTQIVRTAQEARRFLLTMPYLYASKFYSKKAGNLRKDILDFNVHRETYDKFRAVKYNGFTFFKAATYISNGKKYPEYLSKVDFNKNVNLLNAFNFLQKIPQFILLNSELSNHKFDKLKELIAKIPKLRDMKTTGVIGAGNHSIVFDLPDQKVLKLSLKPCYPIEQKSFDAPILDKGCYKIGNKKLYYCISTRGKNSNEIRIKCSDVDKVVKKIVDEDYKGNDISSLHFCQVVKIEDDFFLCDYDCAKLKGHKSRLYNSP